MYKIYSLKTEKPISSQSKEVGFSVTHILSKEECLAAS
jgi:hypothetical protein